jgi:hypothetical protein
MKSSEIANRLTDISTLFGWAYWQPAELEAMLPSILDKAFKGELI